MMKFAISSFQLKTILEVGHKLKEIDLIRCEIDINDEFTLDSSIDFHINVLNLRWSCVKNDKYFIDENKLEHLAKIISNTTLKNSIDDVIVRENEFPLPEVSQIFKKYKMDVNVYDL